MQGKNGTSELERNNSTRGSLKKATSTPTVNEDDEEKTSKKLLVSLSQP